jgi:hypothetical protein
LGAKEHRTIQPHVHQAGLARRIPSKQYVEYSRHFDVIVQQKFTDYVANSVSPSEAGKSCGSLNSAASLVAVDEVVAP